MLGRKSLIHRGLGSFLILGLAVMFYAVIFGFSDMKSNIIFVVWVIMFCGVILLQPSVKDADQRKAVCRFLSIAFIVMANIMWLILAFGNIFHYDEAYTIGMISRDWKDIIEITAQDVHTPFYYFALKLFGNFGGVQFPLTKLFSLLFVDLTLVFGRREIRSLYNEEVECAWLLFACFMPPVMVQATTPRMYTMGLFFVTMAGIYAVKCYRAETKKNWVIFSLMAVCSVYVHTFSMLEMFVIYGMLFLVLFMNKCYKKVLLLFASGAFVSLCYLPWLIVLFHQFLRWSGRESGWENVFSQLDGNTIWLYLSEWFSALETPSVLQTLFGVGLFLLTGYYAIEYIKRTKDILPLFGIGIAAVILLAAIWISLGIVPCFLGRYLFPVFGLIWILPAVGIRMIKKDWIKILIVLCVMVSGLATFRTEKILENPEGLSECKSFLREYDSDTDVMMADNYFLLMMRIHFPEEEFMIYGPKQAFMPFDHVSSFTEWRHLDGVETVWYFRFADRVVGNLNEKFEVVESKAFRYSYYDIVVDKYVRKQE